jgi:hypothetical protein
MPNSFLGQQPKTTYKEILHVPGGVTSALTTVYGGDGVSSGLSLSTTAMQLGNIQYTLQGLSAQNTNGNVNIAAKGSGNINLTGSVQISAGTITGITPITIACGGTNASTAAGARTNLGLLGMAIQDPANIAVTGGTLTGVTITGSYSGITLLSAATVKSTGVLGFGTGAGGTVTQATSKSTGVTLNTNTGQITLNNAALASATAVGFTLTNSMIGANDLVFVCILSGATLNSYDAFVDVVAPGSCHIYLRNFSGGSLSEAVVLAFAVIKGTQS